MDDRHSPRSNRFLSAQELERWRFGPGGRARQMFAEGQWQAIRVALEGQGWNGRQIELVHDQLRQGWPLALAKRNVAMLTGSCPLHSRRNS